MSLPTVRSSTAQGARDCIMLFYGPPGVGKTTFINNMYKKVLFISTDRGTRWIDALRVECSSMSQLDGVLKELEKDKAAEHFDLIAVDHVDDLLQWAEQDVCQKFSIESLADLKWGKGWAAYKKQIQKIVTRLKRLNRGVVFVCHAEIKVIKTRTEELSRTMPQLTKAGWNTIIPLCDLVGYCGFKQVKDKETGKRKEVRSLETQPSESLYCKDRTTRSQPEKGWMSLDGKAFIDTFKE